MVDDQEINRDVLGMILEDQYEVLYAENGREALETVKNNVKDLSLVMLDLIMPVMNGFEVLEAMKADEEMNSIPVIVLTAEKSAELKALQMGAADFITKPFDVHEVILARVDRIIELHEGKQLISSAERDPVTGLYRENFFFEYANRIFKYHADLHYDAVVIDVEQFHTLNALNGREFGDRVLSVIGSEILNFVSGSNGIAARVRSDVFMIYCAPQEDYRILLDRVQKRVNEMSPDVNVHLRMGVRHYGSGIEPVLMFDGAVAACNKVRGDYHDPFSVYDEKMRDREVLDQRLLNDLNAAITEGQFQVYYQPKYDIRYDPPVLSSAEALIRWKHPELGMISPGTFIPLFEGNGLISEVDSYVWKCAAAQLALWRKSYPINLSVSVNISRADLFDNKLTEKLKELVISTGLSFKDLKLEITESACTDDSKQLIAAIDEMRKLGFEVEMDDFGSGYSSLNMLSSIPFDVLKMDMRFVRDIENSVTDRKLIQCVIELSKYLKVPVVAEGVETEAQLNILKSFGCELVQGYYFSKPLPADEFSKLIEKEYERGRVKQIKQ